MRKLSAKLVTQCLNADQKRQWFQSEQLLECFGAIQMISCRNWWPWTKPSYIAMTRRQSNNQWSGGIAAHPTPTQKIPNAKIRWKSFRLDFLGSKWHPPHWLSSKGPNYQHRVLLISAGVIEGHFEGKALQESHQGTCSCTTMPWLTGHLQPRRNWPTWASSVLITHSVLQIWPFQTTTYSLDWKKIQSSPFFVRRRGDLVGRTAFWIFFLSGLRKLEQQVKKCIEFCGEYVE